MFTPRFRMSAWAVAGLAALLLAGLWGCSPDPAPTGPSAATVAPAPAGQTTFTFAFDGAPAGKRVANTFRETALADKAARKAARDAAKALKDAAKDATQAAEEASQAAAKVAVETGLEAEEPGAADYTSTVTVSGTIGPKGGRLQLVDTGLGEDDELVAVLHIPARALTEPTDITMTVSGYWLKDVQIDFGPDGLTFLKDATLVVHIGKDRVDVDVQSGLIKVIHTSDDGTVHEMTGTAVVGKTINLILKVPGFSVYSLGGGA
ncbi:MAG: hypothetical protein ABIL09_08385 [Gemmatimonadota bacterium]